VRAAAAAALAAILPPSADENHAIAQGLLAALRDPGAAVPKGIAVTLTSANRPSRIGERIRRELRDHMSAAVRSSVADEPDPGSTGKSEFDPNANPFLRRFRYATEKPESDEQGLEI
jgi:hypothetical protein